MKTNQSRGVCVTLLLLGGLASLPADASSIWRVVATDKGRSIEVDTASIQREPDGKILATGRMVLDKEIVDIRTGEPYKSIQSTTRYDCVQRSAVTLKRSFLRASDEVLREEEVRASTALPVRSGTLDDRVLREICRPPGNQGQAMKVAEKASEAASALRQANAALVQQLIKAAPRKAQVASSAKTPARRPAKSGNATPLQAKAASAALAVPRPEAWAYSGPGGPGHWAEVRPEYERCRDGKRQSPIDIRDGIQVDLEPVQFDYRPSLFAVVDTGYGIEARAGGNRLSLMGKSYELERIRFHRPAEETINGRQFEMGVHLEHAAFDGERLVVAVLLEQGASNAMIQTLWNYLPLEKNTEVLPPAATIDPTQLLPATRGYHTYMGSMTRPPCTEGVIWVVMQTPMQISPGQEAIFARLYPNNARPVQPHQGRLIKSSL